MKKHVFFKLAFVITSVLFCLPTLAKELRPAYNFEFPSLDGTTHSCSGSLVDFGDDGINFVTDRHCFDWAQFDDKIQKTEITAKSTSGPEIFAKSHLTFEYPSLFNSEKMDLVIAKVLKTSSQVRVLPIAEKSPAVGDSVTIYGYPLANSSSSVSYHEIHCKIQGQSRFTQDIRFFGNVEKQFQDNRSIVVTTVLCDENFSFHGASGGPVLNTQNELVGYFTADYFGKFADSSKKYANFHPLTKELIALSKQQDPQAILLETTAHFEKQPFFEFRCENGFLVPRQTTYTLSLKNNLIDGLQQEFDSSGNIIDERIINEGRSPKALPCQ